MNHIRITLHELVLIRTKIDKNNN